MQHVFIFILIHSIQLCATNDYPRLVYSDEAGIISSVEVYETLSTILNASNASHSSQIFIVKDGLSNAMGLASRGDLSEAYILVGSNQSGISLFNLDGTESPALFSGATVRGMVYKDEATAYIGLLYDPQNSNRGIYAVDPALGASAVYGPLLAASPCVDHLAMSLDRQTLFWSDGCSGSIYSLYLIGSNSRQTLLEYLVQPKGFAFSRDFTTMYFIANNSIFRATVSGADSSSPNGASVSGRIVKLLGSNNPMYPTRVVVDVCSDAGKVYWADACMGKIQRANQDGTGIEDFIIGLGAPLGLAIVCPRIEGGPEPEPTPEEDKALRLLSEEAQQLQMPTLPPLEDPEAEYLYEDVYSQQLEMPTVLQRLLEEDQEPEPGDIVTTTASTTTTSFGCMCGLELHAVNEYMILINNDGVAANASRRMSEWIPAGTCSVTSPVSTTTDTTTSGPPRSPEGCLIPQDAFGTFSKQNDKPFDAWLLTCPSGYRVKGDSNRVECDEGNLSTDLSCENSSLVCSTANAFDLVWGADATGVNCSGDATEVASLPDSGMCLGICPNSTSYRKGSIICLSGMLTDMSYCLPWDGEYTATEEYVIHGQIRLTFNSNPDREVVRTALCLALRLRYSQCMYIMKAEVQAVTSRRLKSRRLFGLSSVVQSSRKLSQDSFLDYSIAIPPHLNQTGLISDVRLLVNGTGVPYIAFSNWLDGRGLTVTNLQETIPPFVMNSTVVRDANGNIQGYSPRAGPPAPSPPEKKDGIILIVVLSVIGAMIVAAIVALSVYAWRYGSCRKAEC